MFASFTQTGWSLRYPYYEGQFEDEYKPSKLCNWEIPKWYPENPCRNVGHTHIISNDRGHILPGIYRPNRGPWSGFKGTWDLPKKITRKVANELTAPPQIRLDAWKNHCAKVNSPLVLMQHRRDPKEKLKPAEIVREADAESDTSEDQNKPDKESRVVPYVPGDIVEDKYKHEDYNLLNSYRFKQDKLREEAAQFKDPDVPRVKGFPKSLDDFSRIDVKPKDSKTLTEEFYQKHKEMMAQSQEYRCKHKKCSAKKLPSPILMAVKNFDLARKLHKENLEHKPLPDTVTDALYRKYQMDPAKEPGLALKDGNYASGVAWKAYAGFGPTRCTKLRVFRPKTSVTNKIKDSVNDRPSSVSSFDKKWRFIRQQKVTPMQLAVCWDLTPMDPNDEPKRTPHIDGSNGSLAPAVFSLVHSPKQNPVMEDDIEEEVIPEPARPKTACTSCENSSTSSGKSKRVQSAYEYHKSLGLSNDIEKPKLSHSHSSNSSLYKFCSAECSKYKSKKPEINKRLCVACEMKNIQIKETKPKSEFKLAFKAGVPQKNYKRHDYPEHWRLATVYQHSYKPLKLRKRPLIQTIFK